ncbi:cortical cell-delineating protein [Eutrema salsugineum]|nr:cortical cell-delineating protein [Eutrema salsugineum]
MTTIMALYLASSLVFMGFASAQAPVAQPLVCPLTRLQLQVCVDILGIGVIINPRGNRCCTLLASLNNDALASACACTAARINLLGLTLNVTVRFDQLRNLCPRVTPLPGGAICN